MLIISSGKTRYVEDAPLPAPAARRLAEKEAAQRKRDDWLEVNIHKAWEPAKGGGVGGGGAGEAGVIEFDKAKGREEVRISKAVCGSCQAWRVGSDGLTEPDRTRPDLIRPDPTSRLFQTS